VLEDDFANQAAGIIGDVLQANAPFLKEEQIKDFRDEFGKAIQHTLEATPVDLDKIPEQRLKAMLTSLRENGVDRLFLRKAASGDYRAICDCYVCLPDRIKTLQWSLQMALTRAPLDADEERQREEIRQWFGMFVEDLPESRLSRQQVVDQFDEFFDDPLTTQFDRVMTDEQFAKFKKLMEPMKRKSDPLWAATIDSPLYALQSYLPERSLMRAQQRLSKPSGLQTFDDDDVVGWGYSRSSNGSGFYLHWISNLAHRGESGGLSDFYSGVDFTAIDVRDGASVETLWKIRKNKDPDAVLVSLKER